MANRAELEKAVEEGAFVLLAGDVQTTHRGDDRAGRLPPEQRPTESNPNPAPIVGTIVRDAEGRLTREGMELYLRQGGSVLHGGRVIESVENLPTAADLARGNERRVKEERNRLLAQAAVIQAELAKLETPASEPKPAAKEQPSATEETPQRQQTPPQRQETPTPQRQQQQDEDEDRAGRRRR